MRFKLVDAAENAERQPNGGGKAKQDNRSKNRLRHPPFTGVFRVGKLGEKPQVQRAEALGQQKVEYQSQNRNCEGRCEDAQCQHEAIDKLAAGNIAAANRQHAPLIRCQ